ncbi:MAG: sensor histidine kinase [Kiritimatiellales bacterium]
MTDKPTNQVQRGLTAARRTLQKETARRQIAEEALRKSKEQTDHWMEQSRLLRKQLQTLSRQILLIQEDERKRISRELHDVIAQTLAGINIQLAALKIETAADNKNLRRKISSTQKLVEKSVDIVHRFARELRPPVLDDLGLIPALHALMKKFSKETGVQGHLTALAEVEKLSDVKRLALYRIAQQALTNIARHARASRVDVTLSKLRNAIQLQIKDNGQSFDVETILNSIKSKRMGLVGMRERSEMVGGKFKIVSAPDEGTTLDVQIPYRNETKEKSAR